MEDDPFFSFDISTRWKELDDIKIRTYCSKCSKSRKFFCYTCNIPLPCIENIKPKVMLPIDIDIIKHRREMDGKSTSTHAAIISPDDVTIYKYPDPDPVPDYMKKNSEICNDTVLVYPDADGCSVEEYINIMRSQLTVRLLEDTEKETVLSANGSWNSDNRGQIVIAGSYLVTLPLKKAVFIDSTWSQSKAIRNSIKGLPCIVLKQRMSQFWRHQKKSPRWYLATIEAIHQLLLEIHAYCCSLVHIEFGIPLQSQTTEYDNLLFFFYYMYLLIHRYYDHNQLLSYKRPFHID